jgi:hypothetical protein
MDAPPVLDGGEAAVITAHPSPVRELIERCETLRRRLAAHHRADTTHLLEDANCTPV